MTGSPLLRLVLVVAAMLALAAPLRRLTSHRESSPEAAVAKPSGRSATVRVTLSSTKTPFRFEIRHLGKPVWTGDAAENGAARDLAMPFPEEGIDLLVDASWKDAGPAVLKVDVSRDGGEPATRMLWGDGRVGDVLTFR